MIERALVTGGAGFIGANLVDRLVDDGAEVLVIDDLSTGKLERLAEARREGHVRIHQMDVRDPSLHEVVAGFNASAVFHLAAQIDVRRSVTDPVLDADINVTGTVNVLEAAARSGAEHVVFASSGGTIFGETEKRPTPETAARRPGSPYGVAKLAAEDYLRYYHAERGISYAALGFANVYGPRQDPHGEAGVVAIFTHALLAGESPVIYGDGSSTRDYVFVEDVTDACVRAATEKGATYLNVGTGVETSVLDLFRTLRDLTGASVAPTYAPPREGELQHSALDSSRAKRVLGWEPWTSLQEGLEATVEWFAGQRS